MRVRSLVMLLALWFVAWPRIAAANMAQAVTPGDRVGVLVPQRSTEVRVDRETLSFELDASLRSAKVRANYRMTGGGEASSSEVAFVLTGDRDRDAHAAVVVDGADVPFRVVRSSDTDLRREDLDAMKRAWSKLDRDAPLTWLVFRLEFAAKQTREVVVSYTQTPTTDRAARVNDVYGYEYLLSPAKAWASFGPIEITVRAPGDVSLSSNIPLVREGAVHRATLAGLPPGELSFDAMSRAGLWFGMTTSGGYWVIVILVMVGAAIGVGEATSRFGHTGSRVGRVAVRVLASGGLGMVAVVAILALLVPLMPRYALGFGYGGLFGMLLLVLLAAPLAILSGHLLGRRRARAPEA